MNQINYKLWLDTLATTKASDSIIAEMLEESDLSKGARDGYFLYWQGLRQGQKQVN